MSKKFIIGFSMAVGLGLLILLTVINAHPVKTEMVDADQTAKQSADKVQVYLFHATQRCITCINIGKYAGETVDEYFQPELRDGKIEFREINIDLPENKELAQKFQASGSALFINAIYNGQDSISEDTRVWRLTQDEVQFKSYLKEKINNLLGK
jgi:thiol-disulfide isomerase/thioredoxin